MVGLLSYYVSLVHFDKLHLLRRTMVRQQILTTASSRTMELLLRLLQRQRQLNLNAVRLIGVIESPCTEFNQSIIQQF